MKSKWMTLFISCLILIGALKVSANTPDENRKLVSLDNEFVILDNKFDFRGFSYSMDCMPIFYIFGERIPDVHSCQVFYEYAAFNRDKKYVRKTECKGNRIFNSDLSMCVEVERIPDDCYREVKICQRRNQNHVLLNRRKFQWLIPVNVTDDVRRDSDESFFYKGYHYHKDCFPIFLEFEIGKQIPDAKACNRFYKYERKDKDNKNIISLRTCGYNRQYDDYTKGCTRRNPLAYGCLRAIPGCEGPINKERILIPPKPGRRNTLRYKVPDSAINYPSRVFHYHGFLYAIDTCIPLHLKGNEVAPDPLDCHKFFTATPNRDIQHNRCRRKHHYFSVERNLCVLGLIPEDCHVRNGCNFH